MNVPNFLKTLDQHLYDEYVMESYMNNGGIVKVKTQQPTITVPVVPMGKLKKRGVYENAFFCKELPPDHPVNIWLDGRMIPEMHRNKLLYTSNYLNFIKEVYPNCEKKIPEDERVVIPHYDRNNREIGFSGRALVDTTYKLRYVTVQSEDYDSMLVFGMDTVDLSKPVLVVEGQFDSMFLQNSIAACNSDLLGTARKMNLHDYILIYDNEPRNKEIVKLMARAIEDDSRIVIWPDEIEQKDINEMVKAGISLGEINSIISNNTFSGLPALARFTFWKRV